MHTGIKAFLDKYCPDPTLIASAIQRLEKWGIAEYGPGEFISRLGDSAEACWIIVVGQVEITKQGRNIAFRGAGEMIGEQALITTLQGKTVGTRSADMIARSGTKLICLDAAFQEQLTDREKAAWVLTLTAVVNEKLERATSQRVELQDAIQSRESLLRRFAEGDALLLVRRSADEGQMAASRREVIVWFSDIENFSTWATDRDPEVVAELVRALAEVQIKMIRCAGGHIDKLMGDGLMAVWFIDAKHRKGTLPSGAVLCALEVVDKVQQILESRGLAGQLGIRIGMHSGAAVFGDFGAQDRIAVTVIGDDVNLAARYEQARSKALSSVRISRRLRTLIEEAGCPGEWEFSEPVEVEVKHNLKLEIHCPNLRRPRP